MASSTLDSFISEPTEEAARGQSRGDIAVLVEGLKRTTEGRRRRGTRASWMTFMLLRNVLGIQATRT